MSVVTDILLNEDLDLAYLNGDLVTGDATTQHQALLLLTHQGEWRQDPLVGVGVSSYLLQDNGRDELRQLIRKEFERDGMRVGRIEVEGEFPVIEAHYE